MARKLTLKLEPVRGTIERFYAFVGALKRIADDGTAPRQWCGDVPDDELRLKVRVFGIGDATYRLTIDLPGTVDDQSLELRLNQGYGELELVI
jgi:hypothetical protein